MKREEAAVALATLVLLQTISPAVAADKLGSPRLVLKTTVTSWYLLQTVP